MISVTKVTLVATYKDKNILYSLNYDIGHILANFGTLHLLNIY